jgi:hypothetical protein
MYQFTYTKKKLPDNSTVHRSLQIVGRRYGMCFMSHFLAREFGGGL